MICKTVLTPKCIEVEELSNAEHLQIYLKPLTPSRKRNEMTNSSQIDIKPKDEFHEERET